ISIACVVFSNTVIKQKIAGISLILLLLGTFTLRTIFQYNKSIGTHQFSAFGSWQIAANALYGYAHSSKIPAKTVPLRFRELHAMVNKNIDSIHHLLIKPDYDIGV